MLQVRSRTIRPPPPLRGSHVADIYDSVLTFPLCLLSKERTNMCNDIFTNLCHSQLHGISNYRTPLVTVVRLLNKSAEIDEILLKHT